MPDEKNSLSDKYRLHFFVCTNKKENGESCGKKGSESLRSELKQWAKSNFGRQVRINASGCLGECERGICAVAYPKGKWYLDLSAASLEALKSEVANLLKN